MDNKLYTLVRVKQNQYCLLLNLKGKIQKIFIKYGDIQIKQHSKIKYLGCVLDEIMSREVIALNFVNKINKELKFDYACSAWYPNLTKKLKHIIQTTQN